MASPDSLTASTPIKVSVLLMRDEEGEEEDHTVVAPFYPGKKTENWWVVVGEADKSRQVGPVLSMFVWLLNLVVALEHQEGGSSAESDCQSRVPVTQRLA